MKYHATITDDFKGQSTSCELTYKLRPDIELPLFAYIPNFEIICMGANEKEVAQSMKDTISALVKELNELKENLTIVPMEVEKD